MKSIYFIQREREDRERGERGERKKSVRESDIKKIQYILSNLIWRLLTA